MRKFQVGETYHFYNLGEVQVVDATNETVRFNLIKYPYYNEFANKYLSDVKHSKVIEKILSLSTKAIKNLTKYELDYLPKNSLKNAIYFKVEEAFFRYEKDVNDKLKSNI